MKEKTCSSLISQGKERGEGGDKRGAHIDGSKCNDYGPKRNAKREYMYKEARVEREERGQKVVYFVGL